MRSIIVGVHTIRKKKMKTIKVQICCDPRIQAHKTWLCWFEGYRAYLFHRTDGPARFMRNGKKDHYRVGRKLWF